MNNKNLTYPRYFLFTLILVTLFSSHLPTASAQEPEFPAACGNFIDGGYISPIEDCANPFGRTDDLTSYMIGTETVVNNQTYLIEPSGLTNYGFAGESYFNPVHASVYRHDGTDYVAVDTDFAYPERTAIEEKIEEYFNNLLPGGDSNQITLLVSEYLEIYEAGYKYPYFYVNSESRYFDVELNRYIEDVYYELEEYVEQNVTSSRTALLPGTYTVMSIDTDEGPSVSMDDGQSLLERLWANLVPKAYAYFYVRTVTFTLTDTPPEPEGASSVLFLPGIMGSRLYEEGEFCDDYGPERQLWFSLSECRQTRLATNLVGQSINSVYTKPGIEGILDEALTLNIYKTFLKSLKDLRNDEIISDYDVVPYDWRDSLDDILKSKLDESSGKIFAGKGERVQDGYLYKKLSDLAETSKSGKVTVVAHSNGGLVVKQFLSNLQNTDDPLVDKIDNLILVAVPQTGSPESAVGILQGTQLDWIMPQAITRGLMNKMPFSHHLLPTSGYFEIVETPVVSFESGEATDYWISLFGESLNTRDQLHSFLDKESGRIKPDFNDLKTPEIVDNALLSYARTTEVVQSNFEPVEGMNVYQVAGVGMETPSGLTYFSDKKCISRTLFVCTEYKPKVSYRMNMVMDGDATVPAPSALALSGGNVENLWVNLYLYKNIHINRKHRDILEVPGLISFISDIVQDKAASDYSFVSSNAPGIDGGSRLVFQLHSPLDLLLVTKDGREVSSSTNEIKSATYRRYGDLQYISVPRGEDFQLKLNGLATGSFTLDIDEVNGGKLQSRNTYTAIPSSTSTKVVIEFKQNLSLDESSLEIDYDGDGIVDIVYGWNGETLVGVENAEEEELEVKKTSSSGTRVKIVKPTGVVLGVSTKTELNDGQRRLYLLLHELSILLTKWQSLQN